MITFLDTLLRDSAVGEHFCPTEAPTFVPAAAPRAARPREPSTEPRSFAELIAAPVDDSPTWAGDDFLHALLRRARPALDADRFTAGAGILEAEGGG